MLFVIVWIALVVWLGLVIWSLSVVRAAAGADAPAPAAVLGLTSALVDSLRRRVRGTYLLNNLLTYTTFPLVGGVLLYTLDRTDPEQGGYALAVFAVFLIANALNFLMIAGHTRLLRGGSLVEMLRTVFFPVLPWEIGRASCRERVSCCV